MFPFELQCCFFASVFGFGSKFYPRFGHGSCPEGSPDLIPTTASKHHDLNEITLFKSYGDMKPATEGLLANYGVRGERDLIPFPKRTLPLADCSAYLC